MQNSVLGFELYCVFNQGAIELFSINYTYVHLFVNVIMLIKRFTWVEQAQTLLNIKNINISNMTNI